MHRSGAQRPKKDTLLIRLVKPDDLGPFPLVEVAPNGIADIRVELGQVVGFGKDRLADSPGGVSTFRGLFDHEDELGHGPILTR